VLQITGAVVRFCHNSATSGSAQLMTVRMAESASGVSTLVDEVPLTSLVADNSSTWLMSGTANATARNYIWQVDTTNGLFLLMIDTGSGGSINGGGVVAWPASELASDSFTPTIWIRGVSSTSSTVVPLGASFGTLGTTDGKLWTLRTRDGSIKSTRAFLGPYYGSTFPGAGTSGPVCPHPDGNNLRRQKISIGDNYSQTATAGGSCEPVRAWLPDLWVPMHRASYSGADYSNGVTFPDASYDPSSSFTLMLLNTSSGGGGGLVLETTPTWARPQV
jgi:hypothetical protein